MKRCDNQISQPEKSGGGAKSFLDKKGKDKSVFGKLKKRKKVVLGSIIVFALFLFFGIFIYNSIKENNPESIFENTFELGNQSKLKMMNLILGKENLTATLQKSSYEENLVGIYFNFSDAENFTVIRVNISLNNLVNQTANQTFTFNLSELNLSTVLFVSVAPIYLVEVEEGKFMEILGNFTGGVAPISINFHHWSGGGHSVRCGNGVIETGETCDDGNTVSGDGCSSTCIMEVPNGAPSSLTITVVSDTELQLNWTDGSTNEDGFSIERSTDGVTYSVINITVTNINYYSDTGLNVTTFYYRVRTFKGSSYSTYSNIVNVSEDELWSYYWTTQDLNFWSKSRDGLTLVDEFGNNATILPTVAIFSPSGVSTYLNLNTSLAIAEGEIEVHALQEIPEASPHGIITGTGGGSKIQIRTATQIGTSIASAWKFFDFEEGVISLTSINEIKLVIRVDAGVTKTRCYCNGIESTSGELAYADTRSFIVNNIGVVGANVTAEISYVNVINNSENLLKVYPSGLGLYEYDVSGSGNNCVWEGTPSYVFRSEGSTYLMDNGFTVYNKPGKLDEYVPSGASADYIVNALEYLVKGDYEGSLTKYNLAPALIQMVGSVWDRSNTTIWNDLARGGFYNDSDSNTKKRWHSTELNQANFKFWANEDYKEIVFSKFENNTLEAGRMLEELMAFDTVRTESVLTKTLRYTNYNFNVKNFTSQFVINTTLAQLDWDDDLEGLASYEIWRSINGATKTLIFTTEAGAETYNDTSCKQGAWMKYSIRAKIGNWYSAFSDATIFQSPLCFKTNQSILTPLVFQDLTINSGTVNINWGDGTSDNYTNGLNPNITKNYENEGQYNVCLSGDIRRIITLGCYDQLTSYGDISNWILPYDLITFHCYGNSFTGDISDHINYFSPNLRIYDMQHLTGITGDISDWRFGNTNVYDVHFEGTGVTGDITNWTFPETVNANSAKLTLFDTALTGDISNWRLPDGIHWLTILGTNITCNWTDFYFPSTLILLQANTLAIHTNTFSGDVSGWVLPSDDIGHYVFNFQFEYSNLIGDMSGVNIPVFTKKAALSFSHNSITKMPRGDFKWISEFDFSYNSCDSEEIDALLAYVDAYFTEGVVPLTNATYTLNGVGMGIPSASGLISRQSIIDKYVAAEKTCTITVNS